MLSTYTPFFPILQRLIGSQIEFGMIPNLSITQEADTPIGYARSNAYGHFYNSRTFLLITRAVDKSQLLKFELHPDDLTGTYPTPFKMQIHDVHNHIPVGFDDEDKQKSRPSFPIHREYINTYLALNTKVPHPGFSYLQHWDIEDRLSKVTALLYAGGVVSFFIFEHQSGDKWSLYYEPAFEFWLNFDQELVDTVLEHGRYTERFIIE